MNEPSPPTAAWSGQTVLVTGGAGFIGSHLAAALVPGNEVRVLDDCSTGDASRVPDGAEFIRGDVTDGETLSRAMTGVDTVFHQAAVVSVDRSIEAPAESHRVNVGGTRAVLERARAEDARVVIASSAAVYGTPSELPVSETCPTDPQSPYGADKLAADAYASVYANVYDLRVVPLRYFNVYGPGQRGPYSGVVDAFLERAFADEPLSVHGDGEQTRDFVHVFDVVRANLAAAETPYTGVPFNVGTGESVTIRELADIVREAVGTDAGVRYENERPGDVRHSRASTKRARDRLGFRSRIPLEAGIDHLVSHRREGERAPLDRERTPRDRVSTDGSGPARE
ncbi:NAD-dependent epimerase/dehydratase family protein [Halobellus sp. GM3]|uniref:NAD-dependent epimerase/dehydratase family protein n=1 Tax=Halobellus sp. GM3 TaxID=3458410 RepID=UPI00403E119C